MVTEGHCWHVAELQSPEGPSLVPKAVWLADLKTQP